MAPAQVLSDPDQPGRMDTPLKSTAEMEKGRLSEIKDDTFLRCMKNCEDNTFDAGTLSDQQIAYEAADNVVDILDCADATARVTPYVDPNATDYSSSFGNTVSGPDDGLSSKLSDAEVESQFHYDIGASTGFGGFDRALRPRKKKLTAHWRRYIRPLMWRCKWIELRLREFQSQTSKYDRELSSYFQQKQYKMGVIGSKFSAARLAPSVFQSERKQVTKRRKRKRYEDSVDLASYMSHHSLFSYHEKKKYEGDGVIIDDDSGNQVTAADQNAKVVDEFGINIEWPVLEPRDVDNSLEQILWNIDVLQSRVSKIKTQIDKLVSKNTRKFPSFENSSMYLPSELPTSSARSPAPSRGNGDERPVGASFYSHAGHLLRYETGDIIMQESELSSFGEASSLPDIIESTVNLLSAADVSLNQPKIGDFSLNIVDDVLIHNQRAEKEMQHFEINHPIDKPKEQVAEQEEKKSTNMVSAQEQCPEEEPAPEPVPEPMTVVATEELILRPGIRSEQNPMSKRKQAGQRGRFGRWNAKNVYSRRSSSQKK